MANEPSPEVTQRIADALAAGQKIEAIKIHREATGLGLKESKDFIEALIPRLKEQDPARFANVSASTGKGCGAAALMASIALGGTILFFML